MIVEGIVTTTDAQGQINVAPMGPVVDPQWKTLTLKPFKTSRTCRNLLDVPEGVFHVTDDVELLARSAVGDFLPPVKPAARVRGWILSSACRYYEFRVTRVDDRWDRTVLDARVLASGHMREFLGFNRAKHAVVEAAILASRIGILPTEEILSDFDRLEVLVEKTGGDEEKRAFAFLRERVREAAFAAAETTAGGHVRIRTGSRLHFGLLAPWKGLERRHGGVGMMVEHPGIELTARRGDELTADGPLSGRVRETLGVIWENASPADIPRPPLGIHIAVHGGPPEHVGLGTGTQLTLAVARAATEMLGRGTTSVEELAQQTGRGLRSAIGLHGFSSGGFLVDGGHREGSPRGLAPLLARLEVPEDWSVLLAIPGRLQGLSGTAEREAFLRLDQTDTPEECRRARSAEVCWSVFLSLLPALSERDFKNFSQALGELQDRIGEMFSGVQGGKFAGPDVESLISFLRSEGVPGSGQSSWGPTVFGFMEDSEKAQAIAERLSGRFPLQGWDFVITKPLNRGARIFWEFQ